MRVSPVALHRIREARMSGTGVAMMFEHIVAALEMFDGAQSAMSFDYQYADDEVVEGDLIPVVTLALRPATMKP